MSPSCVRRVDVLIVAAHSGAGPSSSYGDALPWPENAASLVAQQVPGIDAILVGHAHVEIPEQKVVNTQTGKTVILTEPLRWGMRLSVIDVDLSGSKGLDGDQRRLTGVECQHCCRRSGHRRSGRADHQAVLTYVGS